MLTVNEMILKVHEIIFEILFKVHKILSPSFSLCLSFDSLSPAKLKCSMKLLRFNHFIAVKYYLYNFTHLWLICTLKVAYFHWHRNKTIVVKYFM